MTKVKVATGTFLMVVLIGIVYGVIPVNQKDDGRGILMNIFTEGQVVVYRYLQDGKWSDWDRVPKKHWSRIVQAKSGDIVAVQSKQAGYGKNHCSIDRSNGERSQKVTYEPGMIQCQVVVT